MQPRQQEEIANSTEKNRSTNPNGYDDAVNFREFFYIEQEGTSPFTITTSPFPLHHLLTAFDILTTTEHHRLFQTIGSRSEIPINFHFGIL